MLLSHILLNAVIFSAVQPVGGIFVFVTDWITTNDNYTDLCR